MKYLITGNIIHQFSLEVEAENASRAQDMAIVCAKTGIGSGAVIPGPVIQVNVDFISPAENIYLNDATGEF